MPILSWLVRPLLIVSAVIAGWFVAEDAPNFGIVQMVIAVLLIAAIIALAACWEGLAEQWKARTKNDADA